MVNLAEDNRPDRPVAGGVSVVEVADGHRLCGVAVIGRAVVRTLDDGYAAEVRRVCTDGTPRACSMLPRAGWRAVKALGCCKLITYTLPEEAL
jgi:hypothetical protein